MLGIVRSICEGNVTSENKKYFLRFGKGNYARRFLIKFDRGNKIKVRTSFELANDLVTFVDSLKNVRFSGKILMKDKIPGKEGKKKAGVILYEVTEANIKEFQNPYYYLLDFSDSEIVLKIKKALPKPGKEGDIIDESFCSLDIDPKYWSNLKEVFFWDVPGSKKTLIEHTLSINEIEMPKNEKDPVKIRELAVRKGKIIRKMNVDGKEVIKEYNLEV